jgi:hypothetical protein
MFGAERSPLGDALLVRAVQHVDLCALVGFDEGTSDDISTWRTAAHESGHALAQLVEGVDFARVYILGEGKGGGISTEGLEPRLPGSSFEARVASDVAGAVAEELVFGDVEASGVETDLRVALARCYVHDPLAATDEDAEGVGRVREQVARVREILRRRRPALEALARELLRAKRLSRLEAARIVRSAGSRVHVRPRFSPIVDRREHEDCERARELVDEHQKHVRALASDYDRTHAEPRSTVARF